MILPTCQFSGAALPWVIRRDNREPKYKTLAHIAIIAIIACSTFAIAFDLNSSAWAGTKAKKSGTQQTAPVGANTERISALIEVLFEGDYTEQSNETPASPPKPVKVAATKKNRANTVTKTTTRQREAQIQSIVALFAKYNKELNGAKGRKYAEYIIQASEKFNQDPFVIAAIIVHESSARSDVISKGGDYGLMQVRWKVHQAAIKKKYPSVKQARDVLDPRINVLIGTEIFANCRKENDVRSGVLRYSSGNTKLANKVFASMKILQDSYQKNLKTMS